MESERIGAAFLEMGKKLGFPQLRTAAWALVGTIRS